MVESVHNRVLLLNALADDRIASEDIEPCPLSRRAYRDARGVAKHPQHEVTPLATGQSEHAIPDWLNCDVALLARNTAHRDALRRFDRLGKLEAHAGALRHTLENER